MALSGKVDFKDCLLSLYRASASNNGLRSINGLPTNLLASPPAGATSSSSQNKLPPLPKKSHAGIKRLAKEDLTPNKKSKLNSGAPNPAKTAAPARNAAAAAAAALVELAHQAQEATTGSIPAAAARPTPALAMQAPKTHKTAVTVSSNTDTQDKLIKRQVDLNKLPPEVDFWVPGRNVLLVSHDSNFAEDIKSLRERYSTDTLSLPLSRYGYFDKVWKWRTACVWMRDCLTLKTSNTIHINTDVKYEHSSDAKECTSDSYYAEEENAVSYNNHASPYIGYNLVDCMRLEDPNNIILNKKPLEVAAQGGNFFHCVNAEGIPYVIVGEVALTSARKIKHDNKIDFKSSVGSKSAEKYALPTTNAPNTRGALSMKTQAEFIARRKLNKQILKRECGNTNLVIVPNSFFYHIDIEMCPLPNGVVLLHSPTKSLKFLEEHKSEITDFLEKTQISKKTYTYQDVYKKTKKHHKKTQHLFDHTQKKLEKRGFIVMPVCGFLTASNTCSGIFATGFNGLPVVLPDGKILYTVPKNENWFQNYFEDILKKAGVSIIEPITSEPISFLREKEGFFRCQTNTVPKELVASKPSETPKTPSKS